MIQVISSMCTQVEGSQKKLPRPSVGMVHTYEECTRTDWWGPHPSYQPPHVYTRVRWIDRPQNMQREAVSLAMESHHIESSMPYSCPFLPEGVGSVVFVAKLPRPAWVLPPSLIHSNSICMRKSHLTPLL